MTLGLCVSYPSAMPERAEIETLGPDLIRIFTYSFAELDRALAELPSGVQVVVTINNEWAEVQHDWSGWVQAARDFGPRFRDRVQYVALGNENDIWHLQPPIGAPDPKLTPEWSARMAADVAAIYAEFGMQPILPSVASGQWQHYLDRMVAEYRRLATVPAWADLHLYVKQIAGHPAHDGWQEAADALRQALDIVQMPVCSTEGGIKVGDAGGAEAHAEWTRRFVHLAHSLNPADHPFISLFCHSDRGGAPGEQWDHGFGLRTPNLTKRPAWDAFKTASGAHSGESDAPAPQPTPEPIPLPIPPPIHTEELPMLPEKVRLAIWRAHVPTAAFNPAFGIEKAWSADPYGFGPALTEGEITGPDGMNYRPFAFATIRWHPSKGAEIIGAKAA